MPKSQGHAKAGPGGRQSQSPIASKRCAVLPIRCDRTTTNSLTCLPAKPASRFGKHAPKSTRSSPRSTSRSPLMPNAPPSAGSTRRWAAAWRCATSRTACWRCSAPITSRRTCPTGTSCPRCSPAMRWCSSPPKRRPRPANFWCGASTKPAFPKAVSACCSVAPKRARRCRAIPISTACCSPDRRAPASRSTASSPTSPKRSLRSKWAATTRSSCGRRPIFRLRRC